MCRGILVCNLWFDIITYWIKWVFPTFPKRLQIKPGLWGFVQIFQVGIPTHASFICKWSFWDGLWTFLELSSPRRFHEWISTIVSTLFSYCTKTHVLRMARFLTMTKPSIGVHPITVGEMLYRFTNYNLCLQFFNA
jgi:hypothetical protein